MRAFALQPFVTTAAFSRYFYHSHSKREFSDADGLLTAMKVRLAFVLGGSTGHFLYELRFQAHLTNSWDFTVYVVIAVDQANTANLGSDLDDRRRTLDLQVLDHGDCVAIHKDISDAVTHVWRCVGRLLGNPFVSAFWSIQQCIDRIDVDRGTFGTWR